MTAAPLLEARGMTRILPGPVPVVLVKDVNLVIDRGEFVAVTGPSGSGKSSLLYLLGLLDVPTEGSMLVDGRDTSALDAATLADLRLGHMGFVFQFHFLLPEFTALANIMLPMRRLGRWSDRDMRERAEGLLANLGLADHAGKRPDQMSGGQRQRVALARALANDPQVILADEPTGNLDTKGSEVVFDILGRLAGEAGKTVVAVTHNLDFAARTGRQVHIVDGRIVGDTAAVTGR